MRKVKAAIIGCGLVSSAHAAGYLEDEKAELVAVCDIQRDKVEAMARDFGVRKKFLDYNDLLKDKEIDMVDICTPPYLHATMTVAATEAGKHVLVEKPMCESIKQADQMISAAKKAGVTLMVGESYVFTTSHMKARELIDQGAIGKPLLLAETMGIWLRRKPESRPLQGAPIPFRHDPVKSCGGLYRDAIDHFPHATATARYLMQDAEINRIYAWSKSAKDKYGQEEKVFTSVMWQYSGGEKSGTWVKRGNFDQPGGFSTTVSGTGASIEVLGEGAGSAISGIKPCPLVLYEEGKTHYYRIDEGDDLIWVSQVNYYNKAHRNVVHHFIECLAEDKRPRYSGEEGKIDLRLTLTAIKSAIEEKPLEPNSLPENWIAYSHL